MTTRAEARAGFAPRLSGAWTLAPIRRYMVHVLRILLRRQGPMAAFANVKTSPYLGLNIKYGIYPLYDGVA